MATRRSKRDSIQLALTDWATANGIRLNYNAETSVASFTANGRLVVLPLASNQIKVGARWHKATEISLLHGDDWYVPKALLDATLGD